MTLTDVLSYSIIACEKQILVRKPLHSSFNERFRPRESRLEDLIPHPNVEERSELFLEGPIEFSVLIKAKA